MGDLQFAKQFLTSLDNKPTKYQPDHVFDPKTFQMRIPVSLPWPLIPPVLELVLSVEERARYGSRDGQSI